jgi:hypothetical protein
VVLLSELAREASTCTMVQDFRRGLALRHHNDERISVMLTLISGDHRIRVRDGGVQSQFFGRIDRRFQGLAGAVSWPNASETLCSARGGL